MFAIQAGSWAKGTTWAVVEGALQVSLSSLPAVSVPELPASFSAALTAPPKLNATLGAERAEGSVLLRARRM